MAKAIPAYSYTGSHTATADDVYWYIYLYSSGVLTFTMANHTLDAFLVGGGGGASGGRSGISATNIASAGAGGGYTTTGRSIVATVGVGYPLEVGAGGGASSNGGTTTAFGLAAGGGYASVGGMADGENFSDNSANKAGGNGGSGGGCINLRGGHAEIIGFNGGTNGGNGINTGSGSLGQGTTTKPFGEDIEGAIPYSGGGGGGTTHSSTQYGLGGYYGGGNGNYGNANGIDGVANSGGGGGGKSRGGSGRAGVGGSGLIIIRGTDTDTLPVNFNGVQLTSIVYSQPGVSVTLTSLFYNGVQLF